MHEVPPGPSEGRFRVPDVRRESRANRVKRIPSVWARVVENERPSTPSVGLHQLMTAARTERMVRQESFDDIEDCYTTSIDFMLAFAAEHPESWAGFLQALGLSDEAIKNLVGQYLEFEEVRAVRMIIPTTENGVSQEQANSLNQMNAPISQPVYDAMRTAVKEARARQSPANPGRLMELLFIGECQARALLLSCVAEVRLTAAYPELTCHSVDSGHTFDIESIRSNMNSMLDKMWPKIREEADAQTPNLNHRKEELYAKNPEKYHTRINLVEHLARPPLEPKYEFCQRSGGCLAAAEVEARIRKAPEITIDHMFFSLLQEGLETTALLESKGVDWRVWRSELDERIPTFEGDGVRFPPNARNLGMNLPSERVLPPMRPISEYMDEGRSDQWREDIVNREKFARDRKFSDALWLFGCLSEPKTFAYEYLTTAGITVEDIKAVTDN